jgi:Putative  PD-(D/E)XK family member, (DUF4420)
VSGIAPEVWSRLACERLEGETLWARHAAPEKVERLVAALDADVKRHLLVRLLAAESDLHDTQSRGLGVVTRELAVRGHETGRYLDIICHDAAGHETFDLIGGELAERLAAARDTAPEVVARVLAKWRRFWGQLPRQMLSREEQLGLFAELWFLSVWLIPRVGISRAVAGWRGPFGARHDFEWPEKSIEIKATTSTRGRIHRIHGLEQLAPPESGQLLFFSLRLRDEAGASNALPGLIAACRAALEPDADAVSRFESGLAQVGYSPVHDAEYAKLKLRVVDEGLFRVEADFPRLTPASFTGGVPAGVERIDYETNLSGAGHLLIATSTAAVQGTLV